jgi:peptide/nickel transport system permease protein
VIPTGLREPLADKAADVSSPATVSGAFRRFRLLMLVQSVASNPLGIAGATTIACLLVFCFIGPLIYHTDQVNSDLARAAIPPGNSGHVLGTDEVGYDQLGRLMLGGQSALEVGVAAAFLAVVFGTIWGAIAGFIGGVIDHLMMRVVDALLAVPFLFLLIYLASITPVSVPVLILVIAIGSWLGTARLIRGETLALRVREYVLAVTVMGGTGWRSIFRHIIPNTVGTIAVNATFQVADAILTVAGLSYLGFGLPPPATNWGSMLTHGLQFQEAGYWWLAYPPGIAIVVTVLGFNFLGEGLRSAFESSARSKSSVSRWL